MNGLNEQVQTLLQALIAGKTIQVLRRGDSWEDLEPVFALRNISCLNAPGNTQLFRVKPKRVTIDGMELPPALQERPISGAHYYVPDLSQPRGYMEIPWFNDGVDNTTFDRGMAFKTAEDAAIATGIILDSRRVE